MDDFLDKVETLIAHLSVTIDGVSKIVADVKDIQIKDIQIAGPHFEKCEHFYYFTHLKGVVPSCSFYRPPVKKELREKRENCPYPAKRCKFKSFVEKDSKMYVLTNKKVKDGI